MFTFSDMIAIIGIKNCKDLKVETPTDAIVFINTVDDAIAFKKEFGNHMVRFNEDENLLEVPAFKAKREAFISAKMKECARWGCN